MTTFKKHPGIWFTTWAIITLFLLGFELYSVNIRPYIRGSILFFWFSMCFYWITYFHVQWVTKLDKKSYEKEKEREKIKNEKISGE